MTEVPEPQTAAVAMPPLLNRELAILAFNRRVLAQAQRFGDLWLAETANAANVKVQFRCVEA